MVGRDEKRDSKLSQCERHRGKQGGLSSVGRVGGAGSDVHLHCVVDADNPTDIRDVASLGPSFSPATLDSTDFEFFL